MKKERSSKSSGGVTIKVPPAKASITDVKAQLRMLREQGLDDGNSPEDDNSPDDGNSPVMPDIAFLAQPVECLPFPLDPQEVIKEESASDDCVVIADEESLSAEKRFIGYPLPPLDETDVTASSDLVDPSASSASAPQRTRDTDDTAWAKDDAAWTKDATAWSKDDTAWTKDDAAWTKDDRGWKKPDAESSLVPAPPSFPPPPSAHFDKPVPSQKSYPVRAGVDTVTVPPDTGQSREDARWKTQNAGWKKSDAAWRKDWDHDRGWWKRDAGWKKADADWIHNAIVAGRKLMQDHDLSDDGGWRRNTKQKMPIGMAPDRKQDDDWKRNAKQKLPTGMKSR